MKSQTNELSNVDIVLYALFKLGGITKHVHTEEIAWEAYKAAPEKFSWRLPQFREKNFPDKTPVRFALESAKKKEYGQLIYGRAGGDAGGELEGWSFTPKGARWIKENGERIGKRIIQASRQKSPQASERDKKRFIKRIKNDLLYKMYETNRNLDSATIYMFADMLVCAPDASRKIIRKKFDYLCSKSEIIGDTAIQEFFSTCREKFQDFLYE